jgi:hypothetical protein
MSVSAYIFERAQTRMLVLFWHVASLMALLLVFSLPGCLLQRLYSIREQLCDFEDNFQIVANEGVRLLFLRPILLDKDVIWLAGAKPSQVKVTGNELLMRYIIVKESASHRANHDIPIQLRFLQLNGAYRLEEVYLNKSLTSVVTSGLITQCLRSVCNAEKSIVGRSVKFDLKDLDRALLLTRSEVIDILGEPNRVNDGEHKISYNYKLKNNDKIEKRSQIDAYFNASGSEILRVRVSSLRYYLDADFVTGEAILKVRAGKKSSI